MKKVKCSIRNQKGQGVMEYVILTGLIGIFCLAAVKRFGTRLDKRLDQITTKIGHEITIN